MATASTAPSTNRALLLSSRTSALSLVDRPIPDQPTPGAAIVKILALPLLPYMRSILNNTLPYPLPLPLVPGSSPTICRIHALPPDATTFETGQLAIHTPYLNPRDDLEGNNVILMGINGGGSAASMKFIEHWRDATMAEFASVPLESLTLLNEELLCGKGGFGYQITDLCHIGTMAIPFGGLCAADVKAGDVVVVAPATGRFGGAAVQVAVSMGARVIACGRNPSKLKVLEEKFGAGGRVKSVVLVEDAAKDGAAIREACGGGGADVFLDMAPAEAKGFVGAGVVALRRGGAIVLMGGVTGGLEGVYYGAMVWMNLRILGRFMYERADMARLVRMVEGGIVEIGEKAGVRTLGPFSLEKIEDAMTAAETEAGFGSQAVVVP